MSDHPLTDNKGRCHTIITAAELQKMNLVIEAAKCIRHWHDTDDGGMVVSAEHVRRLWAALQDFEKNAKDQANEK